MSDIRTMFPYGALVLTVFGSLASFSSGSLVVQVHPHRPQAGDHVTLRCYTAPARVRLLRDCQFHWNHEQVAAADDARNSGNEPSTTFSPPVTPWWKVPNLDDVDTGSLAVIDEMSVRYEGRYVCRLLCKGGWKESGSVIITVGPDSDAAIREKNSQIAYVTTGIVVALIVLATVLRFVCAHSYTPCCWSSHRGTSASNTRRRNRIPMHLTWLETLSSNISVHAVIRGKSTDQQIRPTILANNVWLPPYDAATRHSRLVSVSSVNSEATDTTIITPPPYEEAVALIGQQFTPSNINSGHGTEELSMVPIAPVHGSSHTLL